MNLTDYKAFKFVENIEKRYTIGDKLGQGNFGVVRQCVHKETGKTFAIKLISKGFIASKNVYKELLENEFRILSKKSHPNLIRIIDLFEDNTNYYIVSEIVHGGELFHRLARLSKFTEQQAADVIYQIMLGLNYLHQEGVIHRDLKPENILLTSEDMENFDVKIADLGFACNHKENGADLVLGSPLYIAPELFAQQHYDSKIDVWSLGIITF